MFLSVIMFYCDRKRNVRRKVLQDGDDNDHVDNDGDTAMEVGDEADSQVSHKLTRKSVHCIRS